MSYSLYISHHLLLTWLAKYNPAWVPGRVQILTWVGLALAVSAALHEFFERPVLTWLKIAMPKLVAEPSLRSLVQEQGGVRESQVIRRN